MNYALPLNFFSNQSSLNAFTLIHRGTKFPVNPLILKIVSPKICNLIEKDIHDYEIPCIPGPINDFILLICGKTVELNTINSKYFNFWAEDLEIQYVIDETENFLISNDTCDTLIEFVSLLIEFNFNYEKYIKIMAEKIEQITTYYPFESLSPQIVGALCNCPSFDVNKYLPDIFKIIDDDPEKNAWIIKCLNFSKIPSDILTDALQVSLLNLNLIRTHLIGYALDFNQKKDEISEDPHE